MISNIYEELPSLEYEELPSLEEVGATIELMVAAMMLAEFPSDGVISQFGVSVNIGDICISLSNHKNTAFLCMVYHRSRGAYLPGKWFEDLLNDLGWRLGVKTHWNGGDGHYGVSVVLDVVVTDDYLRCRRNYVGLVDQSYQMDKFDKEWEKAWKEVVGDAY